MRLVVYRPSARALGAIAVLAAWAGSLGWLGARELGQDEAGTISRDAGLRLAPMGAWYAVFSGATQVGSASITLDTLSPGFRIVESQAIEMPADGRLVRGTWRTETRLSASLGLDQLHARYSRPSRPIDWTIAEVADSLTAHSATGRGRAAGKARIPTAPTPAAALSYRLAVAGGLAPGRTRKLLVVAGWPPGGRLTAIAIGSDSTATYPDSSMLDVASGRWIPARTQSARVSPVTVDGVDGPYRIWVDHRGAIVALETLVGIRWARSDFDIAVSEFGHRLGADSAAIRQAFPVIRAVAAMPADSGRATRRYVVAHRDGTPVDPALLALLAGGRQSVSGDTIIVAADPAGAVAERPGAAPDPMVQSEAAAIVAFARPWAGASADEQTLARMIAAIRQAVVLDTGALAPDDALGTLVAHRGRPDGMARLLVAVARAAGLTARYVVGVAPRGEILATHAWAEVWGAGGRSSWYAVDPVSASVPAPTDLIRLAYGGSSYPEDMLSLLANARFTAVRPAEAP